MKSIIRKSIASRSITAKVGGAMLVPAAALLLFVGPTAQASPSTHTTTNQVATRTAKAGSVTPSALGRFCRYTGSQPTLREGSRGTAVKQAQCEINYTLLHTTVAVDGDFGPKTLAAVRQVQSCAHIHVDGIIGPDTWSVLNYWNASNGWLC